MTALSIARGPGQFDFGVNFLFTDWATLDVLPHAGQQCIQPLAPYPDKPEPKTTKDTKDTQRTLRIPLCP